MKKTLSVIVTLFFTLQCFATIWTVSDAGLSFSPDSLAITQGDSVLFILQNPNNAQEVGQADWIANNSTPITGFNTPVGGALVTSLSIGTHYYICSANAASGMKGKIVVLPAPPSLQFVVTSTNISEAAGTFDIAVSITNPDPLNATSVDINVAAGATATAAGVDYSFSPFTVTFPAGDPFTKNVTITLTNDQLVEGNENFTLKFAFPTNNATIGANNQHAVTILDNDTLQLNIYPSNQNQFENAGTVNVPVELRNTSNNPTSVTLHLETATSTATQGSDFIFNDTTITWAANTSSIIFVPVVVIDDALFEQDETVRISLTNATNGAVFLNDTFYLQIRNNDTVVALNCGELFFSEYVNGSGNNKALEIYNPTNAAVNLGTYKILKSVNGGTSNVLFGLTGILPSKEVYVAANNSAASSITSKADTVSSFFDFDGNDALALIHATDTLDIIGQLGVNPGAGWAVGNGSTQSNNLIRSYYNYHGDTSWVAAANTWKPFPSSLTDSLGFHNIADCGTPEPAVIRFISRGIAVAENIDSSFVIAEVTNPGNVPISYILTRNDATSTATIVVDYRSQTLSFNHGRGVFYDTVYCVLLDDQLIEPTEIINFNFIPVSGPISIGVDSVFTISVLDNDTLTFAFNGAGFSYVEDTTPVQVKVTISSPVDTATRVLVSLAPGNATRGADYTFSADTLLFLPGVIDTQSFWITIIDDTIIETNEQINFNLTSLTENARLGITAYTLTIIDNDSPTGINDYNLWAAGLKLYPNPASMALTIETENDLSEVQITDPTGKTVIQVGKLNSGRSIVDISGLESGMYFISIKNEFGFYSKRFVKQN